MIAYKRQSKTPYYLAGIVCTLYLTFASGCSAGTPTRGEAIREHSTDPSSHRSTDIPKKEGSASGAKKLRKAVSSPSFKKVSSSLKEMIAKMEALGITKENASELEASSLSTPLVRVNDEGSIQTYVHVRTFGVDEKALLEAREVVIEVANEELGIIQAWIPFDQIYEVAELPFVKRITPPRYGTPKEGSIKTETGYIFVYS